MGFFKDLLINLGLIDKPKFFRKGDRRRNSRRWERTSEYKASPEYQARLKRDRRKKERRK